MAVNQIIHSIVYERLKPGQPKGLCFLCSARLDITDSLLCSDCALDLPFNNKSCPICANPGEDGVICASCLQLRTQPIRKTFCVYRYEYPLSHLIQRMKFDARLDVAAYLGGKIAKFAIEQRIDMPECLIPVPLHPGRLRERGFNQSLELARMIARETGIPLDHKICERSQNTSAQTGLAAYQRRHNIKGAFKVNKKILSQYKHVTIIDDVVTTGSTVHELARAIEGTGLVQIDVWACARAVVV